MLPMWGAGTGDPVIPDGIDPALLMSLQWYAADAYPRLRAMGGPWGGGPELQGAIDAIGDFITEVAPYRDGKGDFPRREIPGVGELSLIQAIAWAGTHLVMGQVDAGHDVRGKSPILEACLAGVQMAQWFKGAK